MNFDLPSDLRAILESIREEGGRGLLVGGCVRDAALGLTPQDYDVEVYGLNPGRFKLVLGAFGQLDLVGKSFGVFKLGPYDFSLPRRDRKVAPGHKGFEASFDPEMPFHEALARRDFTINAMGYDPLRGDFIDPFGGMDDLHRKILCPVGLTFAQDPLRVLRGMQFASRFDLAASIGLTAMALSLLPEASSLPRERIWAEWQKWATGRRPSAGLAYLYFTGWISLYPEIHALGTCPQDPVHHPEGNASQHTFLVCDAAAEIADREGLEGDDRTVLLLTALCHDFGKPATTVFRDGRWRSPGHAEVGVPITDAFLAKIGCPAKIRERVLPLVAEHMFPVWEEVTRRSVRRLKIRLAPCSVQDLLHVMEADRNGRPPLPRGLPEGAIRLKEMNFEMPPRIEPILLGRHLIGRGTPPGPGMGLTLKMAFEAQLDGEFEDLAGGLSWLDNRKLAGSVSP